MIDLRIYEIARHYGQEHQAKKALEELAECDEAINDVLEMRSRRDYSYDEADEKYEHLAEEIADVRIMLLQVEHLFGLRDRCDYQFQYKLGRQMKRIERELSNDKN